MDRMFGLDDCRFQIILGALAAKAEDCCLSCLHNLFSLLVVLLTFLENIMIGDCFSYRINSTKNYILIGYHHIYEIFSTEV
jgi:hypothetical protein